MEKSPEFEVVEKVLKGAGNSEEQLEQSWIDHYISLADQFLKRSTLQRSDGVENDHKKAA